MGDPKKQKKKYQTPLHPWQKLRIEEEKEIIKSYGLKNKKEIWKMNSFLRKINHQIKKLTSLQNKQAELEKKKILDRLQKLGLATKTSNLDEILGLTLKNIMERRLQTVLVRKFIASSMNQARQFITHKHVAVNGKKITSPSYLVSVIEENSISFSSNSPFSDANHPARSIVRKEIKT